uniref:uncharacterized protein LOC100180279 isoform X3 n=1 Tax=Ciona intestinalis TaxID=7719 RepID=UPI000EF54F6F|nr:uncharacterized protein LOC100180279 isoform X3 [Ciona intestinalis]|eukprot:XP_026695040.1 uncharacterized protein LOC100180279 isoform X3 [Ciona intestinalis]
MFGANTEQNIMSGQGTMDELLTHLMLMGFNAQDCHDAISFGNLSTQQAVDWILAGKPRPSASSGHLVLPKKVKEVPGVSQPSINKDGSLFKPEQEPPVIHSRFAESRDARLLFMNNKRMKLESEVKREKKLRKKEREDILKEIESDRRAKEGKSQTYDDNASSVAMPTTSAAPGGQNDSCLIQIRLPDARNLRHEFSSEQKIDDILMYVKSNLTIPQGKKLSLLQPFPRKEFNPEDPSSIRELGFCPKTSLVARFVDQVGGTGSINVGESPIVPPIETNSAHNLRDIMGTSPPGQRYSFSPPRVHDSAHHWPSGGQRLGHVGENVERNEISPQPPEDEEEEDMGDPMPPVQHRHHIPAHPRFQPHRNNINQPIMSHNWGQGRGLLDDNSQQWEAVEENHDQDEQEIEARNRRDHTRQAIENRLRENYVQAANAEQPSKQLNDEVENLLDKSLKVVLRRIKAKGRLSLSTLGVLPQPLSEKVLTHLIDSAQLNPNTIPLFRACPPTKLVLDYYKFATNQLLQACRIFNGLRVLSLRSCSLLTDPGCSMLAYQHKLQYLDVSGCSQLTNQFMHIIQELELRHLAVDGTRISDEGVSHYFHHKPRESLIYLSLKNLKGITCKSLKHEMKSLRSILLDQTSVHTLEGLVTNTPNLHCLSIAGCIIDINELEHLSRLGGSLLSLNVKDVQLKYVDGSVREDGNMVFRCLAGLSKLKHLDHQFRLTLTSDAIKYIRHAPLTSLSLSYHRGIDDSALSYISSMTHLEELDLTNTRISDVGLMFISPLMPRINSLFLAKTNVTSQGVIEMLKAPGKSLPLSLLSLQYTRIGNLLLRSEVLNQCCTNLVTLIIRDTKVSDSGLRHLSLPHLTHLLLTDTRVRHRTIVMSYPACPSLQLVEVSKNLAVSSMAESGTDDNDD